MKMSKKWPNATFSTVFTCLASRICSRAAKPAKYENLRAFIRSDAHVVRAGLNIRGCSPLSTPWLIIFIFLINLLYGYLITSTPMYFLSASGTVTEPSAFW